MGGGWTQQLTRCVCASRRACFSDLSMDCVTTTSSLLLFDWQMA
jgi:hypothetical protein